VSTAPQLDLDAPRSPGRLLATTLALFGRHSGLFLSVTLLVVAPAVILVDGVWGRGLVDGPRSASGAATAASFLLSFVLPVLVTALHVVIVRQLGDGREPGLGDALRAAGPRFAAALGATVVYMALTFAGMCIVVVPGIIVLILGYFATQIAVIEQAGPWRAFERSAELVSGRWWRTAGTLLLGWLVLLLTFWPAYRSINAIHAGLPYITLLTIVRALDLSLSALYGTLMYFSLRARREQQALVPA
jgi:hypothetical protein